MNTIYIPLQGLKQDQQGSVLKALAFNPRTLSFQWRVLKCGAKHARQDNHGRSIKDRLQWQYEVTQFLEDDVPLPKALEVYEKGSAVFLALEYLPGKNLQQLTYDLMTNSPYYDLTLTDKLTLCRYAIQVVEIVMAVHKRCHIHRDLTLTNFLVHAKEGKMYLLDTELAYYSSLNKPDPAFPHGTPGYMSPAQYDELPPVEEDDIYSLGVLFAALLGFEPQRFIEPDQQLVFERIQFQTRDPFWPRMIRNCTNFNPDTRPQLEGIHKSIIRYREDLQQNKIGFCNPTYTTGEIIEVVEKGLRGLTLPEERSKQTPEAITAAINLMTGARLIEIEWDNKQVSNAVQTYLLGINEDTPIATGLYSSTAALCEALEKIRKLYPDENLLGIPLDEINTQLTKAALKQINLNPNYETHRLSILHYFGMPGAEPKLFECADNLVKSQKRNGSWTTLHPKHVPLGLFDGIAGIIYFLLQMSSNYDYAPGLEAAIKGLRYLSKQVVKTDLTYEWPLNSKAKERGRFLSDGGAGIASVYIKAFGLTKNKHYAVMAEKTLRSIKTNFVYHNLTYAQGLSGLGEVYLDACITLHTPDWLKRANWIIELLVSFRHIDENNSVYWYPDELSRNKTDLLYGTPGVLHFLLRSNAIAGTLRHHNLLK